MFWICIIVAIVFGLIIGIAQAKSNNKEIEKRGKENADVLASLNDFNPTKKIAGLNNSYMFAVDQNQKKIAFIRKNYKEIIPFSQIISVEILEDNTILQQKSSLRTIGGAVIGGAVAGGAGAIVGGLSGETKQNKKVSSVQVKVRLRDINHPSFIINCFNCKTMTVEGKPVKPDSILGGLYKQGLNDAQRIADTLSVIIDATDKEAKTASNPIQQQKAVGSVADELGKLAELKNKGILTEEEFNEQKKKLLSDSVTSSIPEEPAPIMIENTIEDDVPQEVREALEAGEKILAVKLYMDHKGCGLAEAKKFIDSLG